MAYISTYPLIAISDDLSFGSYHLSDTISAHQLIVHPFHSDAETFHIRQRGGVDSMSVPPEQWAFETFLV